MLPGSVLSWLAFLGLLLLTFKVSGCFCILCVLVGIYAAICTALGISYTRLIRRLRG